MKSTYSCPMSGNGGLAFEHDPACSSTRSKLFKRLVNLGDSKSLVAHPASTTHRQLSPEALAVVGVAPETDQTLRSASECTSMISSTTSIKH